ncbi:MAG: FAD-binding protein [Steroidobacteraceae bacterium]
MMKRRFLLRTFALFPLLAATKAAWAASRMRRRARTGDRDWPNSQDWERLSRDVGGRLVKVRSPLADCRDAPTGTACTQLFAELRNPYYVGDEPGLAQTLGWVGAWTFAASVYAVAAEQASDVAAAVRFARAKNLRLVVKGGGHSYQGTSSAADSLLVWTRHMNSITVHDTFVGSGCAASDAKPAVSVGAGALWGQVYDAVTTQHGRYVQGGGCTTVGVAGLVQSGGFGSFSKGFGSAAAGLLEAEVVTADGAVRIANRRTNSDLFWSLKGGGGGTFGIVTRLTLQTHDLPALFGAVNAKIQAHSDGAYRRLIQRLLEFYKRNLLNAHWGEQIILRADRVLVLQLVVQGLEHGAAESLWKPFFEEVAAAGDLSIVSKPDIVDFPARGLWNPEFLNRIPGVSKTDDRPGASAANWYWAGDGGQCGQVLHGYDSVWLPAALLNEGRVRGFADALVDAAGHWSLSLHLNKGLAGAPPETIDAARDTATNPAFLDAFALAIIAAEEPPAYPGIPGHEPNVSEARSDALGIQRAMAELRKVVPDFACYVSESNFFEKHWQHAFWGANYPRLLRIKAKYDPEGLFVVHHGVGSESWSADGFTRNDRN